MESRDKIRSKALETGFSFCGFAKASVLGEDKEFFESYLKEKRFGGLLYLERNAEKRTDPERLLEGARTVIALLMNYFPEEPISSDNNFIISKYAYGYDYHMVIKEKANKLVNFMKDEFEDVKSYISVDSGPVLEKAWARKSGTGWTGKNTLIINPEKGSFHFIAIIITNLEIEPDMPATDHCGTCHLCADACPTGAIFEPYRLDPSKCISYLTISEKGDIPDAYKGKIHDRIYGCDICQDVCPFNRFSIPSTTEEFSASSFLRSMRKDDWLGLTEEKFSEVFKKSAIRRIGYQKLMQNIRSNVD